MNDLQRPDRRRNDLAPDFDEQSIIVRWVIRLALLAVFALAMYGLHAGVAGMVGAP